MLFFCQVRLDLCSLCFDDTFQNSGLSRAGGDVWATELQRKFFLYSGDMMMLLMEFLHS